MNSTTTIALQLCTRIQHALAKHGFDRNSGLSGGEIVGATASYGSTGFSVLRTSDDLLLWHVVVSGKPHLNYREYFCSFADQDVREPLAPELLEKPLGELVSNVLGIEYCYAYSNGHQLVWDDDVEYYVVTPMIPELMSLPRSGFSNPHPERMQALQNGPDF